jgi:hypothetical protein
MAILRFSSDRNRLAEWRLLAHPRVADGRRGAWVVAGCAGRFELAHKPASM